jgi:hypothetical protein
VEEKIVTTPADPEGFHLTEADTSDRGSGMEDEELYVGKYKLSDGSLVVAPPTPPAGEPSTSNVHLSDQIGTTPPAQPECVFYNYPVGTDSVTQYCPVDQVPSDLISSGEEVPQDRSSEDPPNVNEGRK